LLTIAADCYSVGGLAGFNDNYYVKDAVGTIRNSVNTAAISGKEKVGGITGENSGLIASCMNSGTVTGNSNRRSGVAGIAGRNGNNDTAVESGRIWYSYNRGSVDAGDGSWAGGITGFQNSKSSITSVYNYAEVTADKNSGPVYGSNNSGSVSRSYIVSESDSSDAHIAIEEINATGTTSSITESGFVAALNGGTESTDPTYGAWSSGTESTDYCPVLTGTATAVASPAEGWTAEKKTVYLNPNYTGTDSDGTESKPYTSLNNAVAAAEGGIVYVMSTVKINEGGSYYDSVEFRRYKGGSSSFTDPMFEINAADNSYGTAYVTFTSATIDGGGVGTVFNVIKGRLRLRGNITVKNVADTASADKSIIGVNVQSSGQVEVNYAKINATDYSIKLAGASNTFVLDNFGTQIITISGTVYLGTGAYVTATDAIPCDFAVECQTQTEGTVVVKGSDGYTVTQKDADRMTDSDNTYGVMLREMSSTSGTVSELILAKIRYLDGTQSSNGDGTVNSPYNNLSDALYNITGNEMVVVQGTTPLPSGTYSGSTVIQRGANLDAPMFTVASGQSVMLTWKTLTGRGKGTIVQVNGGDLTLSGGVALINCDTAVDVVTGNSLIYQTVIDADNYSVKVGDAGTLTMSAQAVTSIDGSIYLASGKKISVTRTLPCDISVISASPSTGVVVAEGSNYTLTQADADHVSYNNNDYEVVLDSSNNQLVIIANGLYVDGTAATNGDGSKDSPFNNLQSALSAVEDDEYIYIVGTTPLTGTYTGSVNIRRGIGFTGSMFSVAGNAELSGITVDGGAEGTIVTVNSGMLTLSNGVTLKNAAIAVDVVGGSITVNQAVINATQYSVRMNPSSVTFALNPMSGTQISGTVYFASGKWITVTSTSRLTLLTGEITVFCETATNGTVVAKRSSGSFISAERYVFKYLTGGNFVLGESGTQIQLS
jgi:hypothetical protein